MKNNQLLKGICINCGTEVDKQIRIPLNQMKCPKCGTYTIVRKGIKSFRCFGCRTFWGRCFNRLGRGLGRRFRGGR